MTTSSLPETVYKLDDGVDEAIIIHILREPKVPRPRLNCNYLMRPGYIKSYTPIAETATTLLIKHTE